MPSQSIQPDGIRRAITLTYRHLIKTTMVNALRSVYTDEFFDDEFKGLKISTEFPLDKVNYPMIVVQYHGQSVTAAGVGHEEYFKDGSGVFRKWDHRMFKGSVEFVVLALSPLDRDLLADSLMEVLTMGRMNDLMTNFFYTVYGTPSDAKQSFASSIYVNTDEIHDTGESVGPAPWQPEDVLVFQGGMMADVMGGFYNLLEQKEIAWVWNVHVEPYPQGEIAASINYRPDLAWTPQSVYVEPPDLSIVSGTAQPTGKDIAAYKLEVLADNPLLYWRFEESSGAAVDASGHNRFGALTGNVVQGVTTSIGEGVSFPDGMGQVQYDPGQTWYPTDSFSAECWVTPTPITYESSSMHILGSGFTTWSMFIDNWVTNDTFGIGGVVQTVNGGFVTVGDGEPMFAGSTYHLVLTYDGKYLNWYVNGELKDSADLNIYGGAANGLGRVFRAGRFVGFPGNGYAGVIDEAAMYGTVLSPARIRQHYLTGVAS